MSVTNTIHHGQNRYVSPWMRVIWLLASLTGWIFVIGVTAVATTPITIITVCPTSPPTCDYSTIQQGINAAAAGDTIRAYAGIYAEKIDLVSGITLEAADGANRTLITASNGTIVTANDLSMTVMRGFTISGFGYMPTAIGIEAVNSDLHLADLVTSDLRGADGTEMQPDGMPVTGILISGNSSLTLTYSTIRKLTAGGGLTPVERILIT